MDTCSNRHKSREYSANWRVNNPDKVRIHKATYHARRKALKRELPNSYTSKHWQEALDYFGHCCAVCGRPEGLWHTLAADHWIPITKRGPSTTENIIPLCHSKRGSKGRGSCNLSKGNKDPRQWLISEYGEQITAEILAQIEAYFEWVKR